MKPRGRCREVHLGYSPPQTALQLLPQSCIADDPRDRSCFAMMWESAHSYTASCGETPPHSTEAFTVSTSQLSVSRYCMFVNAELDFSSQGVTWKAEDPTLPSGSPSLTWKPGFLMQDTTDCPSTMHSSKILGKCYKKCPYFSSLSMKYMHNIQESYKKIILLAIMSHLTESLKAHSTIHQAQEYPSGYVYIASLKKSKKESWEQPRAERTATLASWPRRALPAALQTFPQQVFLSTAAAIQNCLPAAWATWPTRLPTAPTGSGRHFPDTASGWAPKLAVWRGNRFCDGSLYIPTRALLYLESWGNQIFNILNESTPS